MSGASRPYRVTVSLYVVFSLLAAVTATGSGLVLLYLAKPFVAELSAPQAARATPILFGGAAVAGALAAVAGLLVGFRFAGRLRGIVRKAEALTGARGDGRGARDEIGALDEALGRLTLSMDRFVRDADILARLPEGMLLLGPAGELMSFNTTAELLLELQLEDYRGVPLLSGNGVFPVGQGNEALARLLDTATVGERPVHASEMALVTARGRRLVVEVTIQHREWGHGSTAQVLLLRDASEMRRIRDEIRRADQLAFLGGMAAKVAHEIRTPLATIRGLAELLQADLPAGDARRAYIDRVIQAVDRQDRLVEDLLTLANPRPESWQQVPVAGLIGDLASLLPDDPRLRIGPAPEGAVVWGDAYRLGEVLANLVKNALEAAPPDGVVEVRAETDQRERVRIRVRNTGSGISPELQERIFQPFFTTKARGTGLGLAIARQIVESHRGRLFVESDGYSETTFVVELPTDAPVGAGGRT